MLISGNRVSETFYKDLITVSSSWWSPASRDRFYHIHDVPDYENSKSYLSEKHKILFPIDSSTYHFMADGICLILYLNEKYKDSIFYIDASRLNQMPLSEKQNNFLKNLLEKNKIDYKIVNTRDSITLNNVLIIDDPRFEPMERIEAAYNNFKKNNYLSELSPYKKVYVSRTKSGSVRRKNVLRLDNEEILENFFRSLNFEIVYAEDFVKMEDAINFFSQVNLLVGVHGANLHNSLFMQPGTTVFELQVPEPDNPDRVGRDKVRFNDTYHVMSLIRGLTHISLYSENSQEFVKNIKENPFINKALS
jgi:hypothetical protein